MNAISWLRIQVLIYVTVISGAFVLDVTSSGDVHVILLTWHYIDNVCFASLGIMMMSSNGNIFHVTGPLWLVNSPLEGQWRGALMFSLICAWMCWSYCNVALSHWYMTTWGPVWLEQNWKQFQNLVCLFRLDFPEPNQDSWNSETTLGGGFIGFKIVGHNRQVSVETLKNLFYQFTIHDLTTKSGRK